MSTMFKDRVSNFAKNLLLTDEEQKKLTQEIVKYVLQLNGQQRTTVLRKTAFALGCLDETIHFKNQFLDVSHYIHKTLWKDVRDCVDNPDVNFCLNFLSKKELKAFNKISYTGIDSSSFDLDKWLKDKIKHLKSKTYKLRFIKEYDPSFDVEDFVQELACEAVRVVTTYERCKSKGNPDDSLQTRLEKYIEGALNNKIRSFIEYHTSGSRRRAMSTNDKLYKKLKSTKKQLNIVKNRHDNYHVGVVETRLKTLSWSMDGSLSLNNLAKKFSKTIVDAFTGMKKVSRDQLRKVLLSQPFEGDDVLAYERRLSLVQTDIKETEGDYYARTFSLEPTMELGAEDIETSLPSQQDQDDKIWLEELDYKVKDPRDSEYLHLVLGDAEDAVENDFVAWVNTNHKTRSLDKFKNRYQLAQKFVVQKYKGWRNKLDNKEEIQELFAI